MSSNSKKADLRKVLLERRDSSSFDYIKIASKQVFGKLKQIEIFNKAKTIASYYPIGSEIKTQDIMQEILASGKTLVLPKVNDQNLIFKKITGFDNLEKASFNLMEPKDECPEIIDIDLVLVPIVGITRKGVRLGYGYGFYDRFLSKSDAETIGLTYAKLLVKSIPYSEKDIKIQWVVSEDEYFKTSSIG